MKSLLPALLPLLSLTACTTPPAPPAAQTIPQDELPSQWPQCPGLASTWGPARGPSSQLNGRQAMTYVKPGTRGSHVLVIYEGRNPRFPEIRDFAGKHASDGQLTILGRSVDFYGSGNEDPEISTQPMQLTSPDGQTGWFSFDFSSPEHLKGKNIPVFTW